jgi:hypothetical protein
MGRQGLFVECHFECHSIPNSRKSRSIAVSRGEQQQGRKVLPRATLAAKCLIPLAFIETLGIPASQPFATSRTRSRLFASLRWPLQLPPTLRIDRGREPRFPAPGLARP